MSSQCDKVKDSITKLKDKIKNKPEIIWEDEHLRNWKVIAEEKQEFYCESLGDRSWEKYKTNEVEFLKLKIGFAIFGPYAELIDESVDEPAIYFKCPEQRKTIEQISEIIFKISESDNIYTAFIFIIALVDHEYAEFPLIRILSKQSECILFIDMLGRVYKGWDDFVDNNAFPCCIYCYPKNGYYFYNKDGKVELGFKFSPESSKLRSFLRKIDTVNVVAGVGSAAIGVAALAVPVSAPVVLGSAVAGLASGVWSTCRTMKTLIDRKKHYQTLSLCDQNARACWISLAAGIIGGASAGAMQYTEFIARSGQAVSKIPCLAVNSLEIGNIGIGGLSIINHIATIVQKKECTLSDSTQLILSILFFFHASLSFKTAKAIILDIQSDILSNVEKELNTEQQNAFMTILHETRKKGLIEGNAEVIKSLKKIENKEIFFQELIGMTNEANKLNASLSVNGDEFITINNNVKMFASDFNSMTKESQTKLLESSKKLIFDPNQGEKFMEDIKVISKQEKLNIKTNEICKKLNIKSLNGFCVDERHTLTAASPDEIYILYKTMKVIEASQKNENAFDKILSEVKKMARSVSCENFKEFILIMQRVLRKYEEYKEAYETLKMLLEEFRTVIHKNKKIKTPLDIDAGFVNINDMCDEETMLAVKNNLCSD